MSLANTVAVPMVKEKVLLQAAWQPIATAPLFGIVSVEDAFLANTVLLDRRTVAEYIAPQI